MLKQLHVTVIDCHCTTQPSQDLHEGPWAQGNLDAGANLVIPVAKPLGGALVVGEDVITYFGAQQRMRSVGIASTIVTAWGRIDADR